MTTRSVINTNFLFIFDYQFIDHWLQADGWGPFGAAWATGTVWSRAIFDSAGWPTRAANGRNFGVGLRVPASSNFAGPYVLTWEGEGYVAFLDGTWTTTGGSNYTDNGGGRWSTVNPALPTRITMTYSGSQLLFGAQVRETDNANTGHPCKNIHFYRLEDETDFLAGNVFRTPWKQTFVDLNPEWIRVMNWTGANGGCHGMRFEHRITPDNPGYGENTSWKSSPPYQETTGTNAMALASATGMPVAMQHGEIVTCRIGASNVRTGSVTVSAITKANPGVVTATAHGFSTGDVIVHYIASGMTQLNLVPCTITVTGANNYSIGVNTTAYTTFTSGTAKQYITLNVGARGAYPVVFADGIQQASEFGTYINAGEYKTFYFDKKLVASSTVNGAWIFNSNGSANAHNGGVPLEICTALVNELNEMTSAGPINLWVTIPHRALLSMDPDYSAGSNFALGTVDVILNGANGYDGLTTAAKLRVEYSNETWNVGGIFQQGFYLGRLGELRYGDANNYHSYSTLRSVVMAEDIRAAFSGSMSRIELALCGQGTLGVSGGNSIRIYGDANFDGDALNTWGDDPIDHFDCFGWACYWLASSDANLATYAATYAAAGSDAAREAACASYVNEIVGTGSAEELKRYRDTLLPAYAAAMVAKGKTTVNYEGGWDHAISGTTQVQTYLTACKRSQAWANAVRTYFDAFNTTAGAENPSAYVQLDQRWGFAYPDLYSGGVEGAALDLTWRQMSGFNASDVAPSLPVIRFRLKR